MEAKEKEKVADFIQIINKMKLEKEFDAGIVKKELQELLEIVFDCTIQSKKEIGPCCVDSLSTIFQNFISLNDPNSLSNSILVVILEILNNLIVGCSENLKILIQQPTETTSKVISIKDIVSVMISTTEFSIQETSCELLYRILHKEQSNTISKTFGDEFPSVLLSSFKSIRGGKAFSNDISCFLIAFNESLSHLTGFKQQITPFLLEKIEVFRDSELSISKQSSINAFFSSSNISFRVPNEENLFEIPFSQVSIVGTLLSLEGCGTIQFLVPSTISLPGWSATNGSEESSLLEVKFQGKDVQKALDFFCKIKSNCPLFPSQMAADTNQQTKEDPNEHTRSVTPKSLVRLHQKHGFLTPESCSSKENSASARTTSSESRSGSRKRRVSLHGNLLEHYQTRKRILIIKKKLVKSIKRTRERSVKIKEAFDHLKGQLELQQKETTRVIQRICKLQALI